MKFGTHLALAALVAAASIALPTASASQTVCEPTNSTCVTAGGYASGSGDCGSTDTWAEQGNMAIVRTQTPVGPAGAGALHRCFTFTFWGMDHYQRHVIATAYAAGTVALVEWYSSTDSGGASSCNAYAMVLLPTGGQFHSGNLGCPAGPPPAPPVLLP